MSKRIVILLFVGLISSLAAWSQDSDKAKKLLDEVSAKVKSYENMEIRFSYTQKDPVRKTRQETNGSVTLKGDLYKLELMGSTHIFDGKKLYNIIPEDEEINISDYDPQSDSDLSPSRMLSFYEKGYSYAWGSAKDIEGRKVQYVKLTPKDKSLDIKEVLLGVDAHSKHINSLTQIYKDDMEVVIEVKSFKTNQPLSDKLFKFDKDKYPGYYINRLD